MAAISLRKYVDVDAPVSEMSTKKVHVCYENDSVQSVVDKILSGAKRVSVINTSGVFRGFITAKDALGFVAGEYRNKEAGLMTKAGILARPTPAFSKEHTIGKALEVFKMLGQDVHPVLSDQKISGIITETDLVKFINKPTGVRIGDIMVHKPFVAREEYAIDELSKMMYYGFSRMPITQDGILIGLVTPVDVLSFLSANQKLAKLKEDKSQVKDFMSRDPPSCHAGWDVYKAVQEMRARDVPSIPVIQDEFGNLVGIISERDIVDSLY